MYYNKNKNYFAKQLPLISVYKDTLKYCENDRFPMLTSTVYNYLEPGFRDEVFLQDYEPFAQPVKIVIKNQDSFEMAIEMHQGDFNPMVLNMASDYRPGGGVATGARAQEEELFRRSNYACVLDKKFYPLKTEQCVYSPRVFIVKDREYNLLKNPVEISCLAVAAIRNPKIICIDGLEYYKYNTDADIMQIKIDMIFKIAMKYGVRDLVLGALGCGAFHNPAQEVAEMFLRSVKKYGKYFRTIGFAVLSQKNNPNFDIFCKVFADYLV